MAKELELFSATQAAAYIGIHPQTMKNWLASGRAVPSMRRRNLALFTRRQLDQLKLTLPAEGEPRPGRKPSRAAA